MNLVRFRKEILSIMLVVLAATANAGKFEGRIVVQWLEDEGSDRRMKVLEPFAFVDDNGKKWSVPKGIIVDGASIPAVFWSMVGPPFVGDYRYASVVHDYYCMTRQETWRATHKMFYEASLFGGVSLIKAKVMYAAVYAGGPRWKKIKMTGIEGDRIVTIDDDSPGITESDFNALVKRIEIQNLSLEQIEQAIE